ncbi:MAG TPA: hypothetical protein VFQ63_02645, partial [Patescibacteria group bacterium]|nr:hypothetical protein [Patescibacteria group bacterium]
EASREVLRRFTENGALDPISLPANSTEIPGGGIVYWNPLTEKVTIHAYSRDAIQKAQGESGPVISTGLTGSSKIIDKPQPPRDSQN